MENHQDSQGMRTWAGLLRGQTIFLMLVGLLVSIGNNQVDAQQVSVIRAEMTPEEEVADLKMQLAAMHHRINILLMDYAKMANNCSAPAKYIDCPTGWIPLEEKCYFFSNDIKNWTSSKDICTAVGGQLAILHRKEQNALEKSLAGISGFANNYYWIGLSDTDSEGVWTWVDNTKANETFWDTSSKQPDNNLSGGAEGEDCVVLNSSTQAWHDVPCEFTYRHICQKDPSQKDPSEINI
ncbi:hypothetical protein UPYG_G00145720 [Umbra pygmaea]|uniref:C-type lectin domain-containing protein n=1 Tax=Umbra pygmaea TaxID=75934 RepID=A0ABD0X0L3_UMBPY